MDGIVQQLLRLERDKRQALIEGNAPAYDDSVRAQLHAVDSATSLEAEARLFPDQLATLAKLIRHNTALFWNLMSVSPVFLMRRTAYTAGGAIELAASGRIQVKG